jgi:hypothetical protein
LKLSIVIAHSRIGDKDVVVTLEDALTILKKWKDESAPILVVAEGPFRQHFRGIHEPGVDWSIGMRGQVSQVTLSPGAKGPKTGIVVFDGGSGNLSLSVGGCAFVYEEPHEAQPMVRAEAEFATLSALSIFFPSNEAFVAYELRE